MTQEFESLESPKEQELHHSFESLESLLRKKLNEQELQIQSLRNIYQERLPSLLQRIALLSNLPEAEVKRRYEYICAQEIQDAVVMRVLLLFFELEWSYKEQ